MRKSLHGDTDEGPSESVEIKVGLRVDRPRPGSLVKRKGAVIGVARARKEFVRLRAEQVGASVASASVHRCEGVYLGRAAEPTLVCEVEHVPTEREKTVQSFRRHLIMLGEKLAERFGQEEVWAWVGPKRHLHRLNAPGERGPKPYRPGGRVAK